MPPSSSQEPALSSQEEPPRRYCAIAHHLLKTPNRKITDPNVVKFAKRINADIRAGSIMCLSCYENLMKLYRMKMANARRHQQRREESGKSLSDVSSSQQMESSSDPSVVNAPQPSGVTMRKKLPDVSPAPSGSSSTTTDDGPIANTSPPAAKKRRTSGNAPPPPPARSTSYISDDDDANSNLSLNAVNGTRLPHIQPIPKRREFVHINKTAMEIYLAGTTGG
ncbi:hypothetical protein KR054_005318 [Drosophila jambulina]|nr:hypothetical protein KR054_005318 [Drosophila jambulina]